MEEVPATLGSFSLALGSTGSMVVRQEVEGVRSAVPLTCSNVVTFFWHFLDLNFKYFWGLYFALTCFHMAALSVDEILSTRMLQ